MKPIFTLLLLSFFFIKSNAQSGIEVISDSYNYFYTSINEQDSTVLTLVNLVNADQIVTFEDDELPFSLSNQQIIIPALDTGQITVYFNPTQTGLFMLNLSYTGSLFGSGVIFFEGEGTLVELTLSSDTLVLPQVSLGESSSSSFTISNTGTGTMSYSINSTSELIFLSSTSGTITSGGSDLIDLTYTPVNSGQIMFNIDIISNDPNNPTTIFTLVGSAVSEKEGDICNESWTPINNPYVFTGNVRVPSDCQLSIEPGTVVDMNGYQMLIEGSLNANGTEVDSLYFENGNFIFRNNEPLSLEYWSVDFPLQDSYTFYHNDFNDNSDASDEEFACYGYNQNFTYENYDNLNTNTGNSYTCSEYYIESTTDYHPYYNFDNSDTKHLRWRAHSSSSNNYDGVLLSKDHIIEEAGNYRIMFDYKLRYNYRNSGSQNAQSLKSYYRVNSNEWILFDKSAYNLYNTSHTEFPISNLINLNVGDTLKIMLINDTEYYSYYAWYYLEDLKIEKVSGDDLQIYYESFEDSSKFETGEWSSANESLNNGSIFLTSEDNISGEYSLKLTNMSDGTESFNISTITIPTSGHYYIQYYMKNNNSSYYHYQNFTFGTGSSFNSYTFFDYEPYAWTSYYYMPYDWEKRSARLGYFEAGETINLRFSTYSNYNLANGSAYDVEVYIDDIRIFNRSESSPSFIAQGNNITVNNSRIDLKIAQLGDDLGIDVANSTIRSVNSVGDNSPISLYNSTITGSTGNGIGTSGDNSPVSLTYSFVRNCLINGIETVGQNSDLNLSSSLISHNGGYGLKSNSKINTNYSNVTFNDNDGIYLLGNSFSNIKNSIIWGNDIENYNQINTQSGVTSITYSSVQGLGAYGTEGSQYYFGDGAIDDDPVFTDQINQHLSTFSNCVDAGTPWESDNHMPFGLGGVRADIGIYGGPDNWFWGGEPIPDGSPIITAISDSPQDQGGIVGVLFDKSVWDDNDLENKVTSYSIWRNFDAEGNSIDTISDGNWQLMGYMPAQSFDAYAYEAPTLGDSSLAEGSFNSCFVILAHTQDSSVYWYSDVMCGYSTDDISPNTTEVFAELVNEEEVMISWNPPTDEDYSYSEVISSSGFNTSNITDTLTYDISFESGDLITYGVIHYDVNGNPSDTSFVSIQIEDQKDYIPLYQGWNLISTRLTPNENNMSAIFSSLEPNNLIYATGFNNGVSVYDPNGLPFLNTLSQFDDGYGYWVKVNEDDTLVINGNPISHDFIPPYNAGWNLMGYTEGVTQSISSYFDFLLNENNLIYVTNFNQGAAFYDPNGLPFLNSLNYVEDNLGYWVKTANPFGGIAYRLSHDSQEYSPNFMLINGESNLSEYIGNKVQVYNQLMEKIAELEIIEGGYLMTNAIYGDDPATEVIEGMENGELLSFGFMNHIIEDKIEFNADMNLRKVNLNFEVSDVISIYPNPLRDLINIRINEADDCELDIQIFDIAGRLVYSDLNRAYFKGSDKVSVDFSEFENGAYYLKLFIDNELRFNESIIKQ
jgi:hypothetical protein